jgi:2-polyprenyl-6-hydroxyphenyl methylase/3-demethylubiquinone-9 3-methyltransferase
MSTFAAEVERGERFEFGKNWERFLSTLKDEHIRIAENAIKEMLRAESLQGRTFLDIGSGSGLSSLAARRLGAKVHSFDFDPHSVGCTQELRSRYFPDDEDWTVQEGSALDADFIRSLGPFDIVYSWGVLHHTGQMWKGIENASLAVKNGGSLLIALYNDEGVKSRLWTKVKRVYCSGLLGKALVCVTFVPVLFAFHCCKCVVMRRNEFAVYRKRRGMSVVYDWFDWLGGYPFEVAKVEDVFNFLRDRGFRLDNLKTTNRMGNNQLVFIKQG